MRSLAQPDLATRILARCGEIAACTERPGEITRPFLSSPMHRVHALLTGWMQAAGMKVSVDAIGNLRGLYAGASGAAPRVLLGSHLDTVPDAGAYDGILGVLLALAIIEELRGEQLPFAIELIGFSEEEGIRFGRPFLGSLAFTGGLCAEHSQLTDAAGITLATAVREFGLDPSAIGLACFAPETVAFFEFHIEQGPVLESANQSLGVVTSIAGQSRLRFIFRGSANHAGTTPMHLRRDALAAAAEWITRVESLAQQREDLVATVGSLIPRPGASNVIPGEVVATLDLRHPSDEIRRGALEEIENAARIAAGRRKVDVGSEPVLEQAAVPLHQALIGILDEAVRATGTAPRHMVSGAGHDAMILAPHLPAGMIFLRTPGGLSHHPDEAVLAEDIEAAAAAGLALLHSRSLLDFVESHPFATSARKSSP